MPPYQTDMRAPSVAQLAPQPPPRQHRPQDPRNPRPRHARTAQIQNKCHLHPVFLGTMPNNAFKTHLRLTVSSLVKVPFDPRPINSTSVLVKLIIRSLKRKERLGMNLGPHPPRQVTDNESPAIHWSGYCTNSRASKWRKSGRTSL